MVRLLPLLLPASPTCACGLEAALPPTTTAPTGFPSRNPGTSAAGVPGVGSPVKKYPAREKPKRATFSSLGEKTCVSSRLSTCSCKLRMSVLYGLAVVGVKSLPLSMVYTAEKLSFVENTWSTRALPKYSRMVCKGLLKTWAMPLKSGAFAGGVIQRFSNGCTLGAACAREVRSGTKAADV